MPPLLGVALAVVLRHPLPARTTFHLLSAIIVGLSALAWWAHALNDLCDIEDDARSAKPNQMTGLSPSWRWTLLLVLPMISVMVTRPFMMSSSLPAIVLGSNYLIFALYSVPPVRLKSRRWTGVFADAAGAHALPTLFVLSVIPGGITGRPVDIVFAAAVTVSAFAVGLRGIMAHQYGDRLADTQAQLRTLGTTVALSFSRKLVQLVIVPVEAVALIVFIVITAPAAPLLVLFTLLFISVETGKMRRSWTSQLLDPQRTRGRYFPLVNNDVYELWFPLALSLQLAADGFAFLSAPLVLSLLFGRGMLRRLRAMDPLFEPVHVSTPTDGTTAQHQFAPHAVSRRRPDVVPQLPDAITVVIGSPNWSRNGVNLHSERMLRGLARRGIKGLLLLTEEDTDLVSVDTPRLPLPTDLHIEYLPVARTGSWGAHWGATVNFLEAHAPCIYLPTFDWRHACVLPQLSSQVHVVGSLYDDNGLSAEQAKRLHGCWSGLVASSDAVADAYRNACDADATVPVVVPDAYDIPVQLELRSHQECRLDELLVCASNLDASCDQLKDILECLALRDVPTTPLILGNADNPEQPLPDLSAIAPFAPLVSQWPVYPTVFYDHIAVVCWMTSDHMPRELIEAMAHGCIPFLIHRGHPPHVLFRQGENCFLFAPDSAEEIAEQLRSLRANPERRKQMADAAHQAIADWFPAFDLAIDGYITLFNSAVKMSEDGTFQRAAGPLRLPPAKVNGIPIFPVAVCHDDADFGQFPTVEDLEDFRHAVGVAHMSRHSRLKGL